MIDITAAGIEFRGAPVTLMSEGVAALLRDCGENVETGLSLVLRTATDLEPSGCIAHTFDLGDVVVWVERFDCTYEHGRHEGGRWSVFLPRER